MPNIFFIGDTHFSHNNILKFLRPDGTVLRDFQSIEEHDNHIVECWNSVVRPQDKVYHLGDVSISKRGVSVCGRLNGHKRLIRGNHDIYPTKIYMEYFEEIYGSRVMDGMIFTHIPIHVDCLSRWKYNVHGHLHCNVMEDKRYRNVSCEQVNYTPISLEELKL